MRIILDRFEGDYAVVELAANRFCNLPRALVPAEAKEGDILEITKITCAPNAAAETLIQNLFED